MSPAAVFFLSVSMSVDAFAVSVGRGATVDSRRLRDALRTGMVFGVVEAMTPFLGWLAGVATNDWVADFDHWIAFLLLAAVGLHMVWGALRSNVPEAVLGGGRRSGMVLLATAFGTSMDAMAVGLSLAFIDIDLYRMLAISAAIGLATFAMSTGGMLLGTAIGDRFGKAAEIGAGLFMVGLGAMILHGHLTA